MSIFEAIMLICFGAAWPFSIYRSYKSKTTKGKSVMFLLVVMIGYLSGITHKIIYDLDGVIILYLIDLTMVLIDFLLWVRNKKIEKKFQ